MDFHKKLIFAIVVFLALVFGGAYAYSCFEGWRYLDALYFTIVTVTTIGYGDFVPLTDVGKIFTMFFSFFGIGMAFYFFTLFGKYIYRKQLFAQLKTLKMTKGRGGVKLVKNES